jgi:hypothetical protein
MNNIDIKFLGFSAITTIASQKKSDQNEIHVNILKFIIL